jgi:hypothetical protein
MADLKDLMEIRKQAEQLRREHDMAVGALKQSKETLKKKYGCSTIKQAEEKLRRIESDCKKAKREFDREVEAFENKWNTRKGKDADGDD